jgi:hypothetical protein
MLRSVIGEILLRRSPFVESIDCQISPGALKQTGGSVNLFTEDACSCLLLLPVLLPQMYKPQE